MTEKKKVVKKPVKNNKTVVNKVNNHKKALLLALDKYKGIISTACESVGISRTQFYNYVNTDSNFSQSVDESQEKAIDFVESKLFEKINGVTVMGREDVFEVPPSDTAIIFYLKTKGRKRGYVEKQEITNTNLNLTVEPTAEEAKKIKDALDSEF